MLGGSGPNTSTSLNFIELLLGDKPPLSPIQSFYQQILASDPDEVVFQAEALLKDITLLDYYQQVALPGLAMAQIDVVRGVMDRARQVEIFKSVRASSRTFLIMSTRQNKKSHPAGR